MQFKLSLLAGGAACALIIAAAASPAAAKPARHHPHHRPPAEAGQQAGEIQSLREAVTTLTARVDAQDAETQRLRAQAQAAEQRAQAAEAQVRTVTARQDQDDNQIKTIPTQVQTAVGALPKPKPTWADNTSVSGRFYYNLSDIEQKSNGAKTAPSGVGFDIKRFYVGVDHKFNDTFSANLTMDMQYASAISSTEFFVKKAYVQAKFSPALIVRLGAADMPWIPFAEDQYGFRFVEQTVSDRTKFGTSSDWGVHVLGATGDGRFAYQLSVVDGAGYKAPLRSKGLDIEGRVSAKFGGFTVAAGGYSGKLGKDIEGGAPVFHTATRFNALGAYATKTFRVGVEYFSTSNWTSVTSAAKDSSDGYSVFGSYNFTPQVSVFGRYDFVKPNKDTASAKKDDYFNIGLNYEPTKIVDFALVYKRDQVEHGTLSTGNGVIGGSNKGTYDEVGLFGQVRW
jgi:hypothetical protein